MVFIGTVCDVDDSHGAGCGPLAGCCEYGYGL
jgi:hypothetical protein